MQGDNDYKSAKAEAKAAKARAKAQRPWYKKKRWWALGLLALIVIIAIAANAGGGSSSPSAGPTPTTAQTPDTTAPGTQPASGPSLTTAQQQAVIAARGYLDLGTGFSERGLLDQLTSSAGNSFSKADAEAAITYLKPNWNQQAVEAAKGYMKLGGFSRASLIEQLTSSAGSGFTQAQAEYAANAVGL